MTTRTLAKALDGQFAVVLRTDAETFIGTVAVEGDNLTIRRGYTGRPAVFPLSEVEAYTVVGDGQRTVDPVHDLTPTGFALA